MSRDIKVKETVTEIQCGDKGANKANKANKAVGCAQRRIGLLPLYLKLYDDTIPELRVKLQEFYEVVAKEFERRGYETITVPICRIKEEFDEAVAKFEEEKAKCIVTLHLAYSPSLESIEALAKTELPVVVLDTTMTYEFSFSQIGDEIDLNHGIHGVMDMCNMLHRYKKAFAIAAGHFYHSDVMDRAERYIKAGIAAASIKGSKTGSIAGSFKGMGDFFVTPQEMQERFNVEIVEAESKDFNKVSEDGIEQEYERAQKEYYCKENLTYEDYKTTAITQRMVSEWIEKKGLDAFTANFLGLTKKLDLLPTVPFTAASYQMENGIGYAGEGDVLTATFVGAFLKAYSETTFIEIFCPDWAGDKLFISHMGEFNPRVAKDLALSVKNYPYTDVEKPVILTGSYVGGKALFVNVYKGVEDYEIVAAPVEMIEQDPVTSERWMGCVRGWLKPPVPVAEFLEKISRAGVTHHSILIYDAKPEEAEFFGQLLNMKVTIIK